MDALNSYKKSLELDPFMWCAYEKICKIDPSKQDPSKIFSEINPSVLAFTQKFRSTNHFTLSPDVTNNFKANLKNTTSTVRQVSRFNILQQSIQEDNDENEKGNFMDFKFMSNLTPVNNRGNEEYQNMNYNHIPVKQNNKPFIFSSSPSNNLELNFKGFNNTESSNKHSKLAENIRPFNIHQFSNSSQLDSSYYAQHMANSLIDENNNFNNVNNMNNTSDSRSAFKVDLSGNKFTDISELLKTYGEILKLVSIYNCEECVGKIKLLPSSHQRSGYVLSIQGRCLFELARYKESEKVFKECLKLEPARLEGIEYFSSCLWHLKDQYQLCTLANHVLEISQFCPETWVVVGNCYSLQREHEVALKFFNRAIQLDNNYAYAYTLCGHEYVDMESYQQARVCYNQAVKIDER
jgi:tetratricopeptide (TPR) repeat protein